MFRYVSLCYFERSFQFTVGDIKITKTNEKIYITLIYVYCMEYSNDS